MQRRESVFINGSRFERAPGGGLVSPYVLLSEQAHLDPGALALDNSEVHDQAKLTGETMLRNFAKVFDAAEVFNSLMYDHTRVSGKAYVGDSVLYTTSEVYGEAILSNVLLSDNAIVSGNANLVASKFAGNSRIGGKARIFNADASNLKKDEFVIIGGTAELDFDTLLPLAPGTRIMEGEWNRPPLVIETPYFYTVEGVNDRISVGCFSHSARVWLNKGYEIFLSLGYTDRKKFDQLFDAVRYISEFKKTNPSPKLSREEMRRRKKENESCNIL